MKTFLFIGLIMICACPALTIDLGTMAPDKPIIQAPPNVPSRQGGDTVVDALSITLPYFGSGTTSGFADDYDESCPYDGSTSPDVVYSFTPEADLRLVVDMVDSEYDTKIYIYDENMNLVACNDDFHPDYTSKLEDVAVDGGVQYFLIIDGYGGLHGSYQVEIVEFEPCVLECPAGFVLENEPPLTDDYVDAWNGGCNSPDQGFPMQTLHQLNVFGKTGYYSNNGGPSRDTDWFEVPAHLDYFEVIVDAEEPTYLFELGPRDCDSVAVIQSVLFGPCSMGEMSIISSYDSPTWLWVGPQNFWSGETYEYNYTLFIPIGDRVDDLSLTRVKSLFR